MAQILLKPKLCNYGEELRCSECNHPGAQVMECGMFLRRHYLDALPLFVFSPYEDRIKRDVYYKVLRPDTKDLAYSHIGTYAIVNRLKVIRISADTAIYEKMTGNIDLDLENCILAIIVNKTYPESILDALDAYASIVSDETGEPVWIFAEPLKLTNTFNWREIL